MLIKMKLGSFKVVVSTPRYRFISLAVRSVPHRLLLGRDAEKFIPTLQLNRTSKT